MLGDCLHIFTTISHILGSPGSLGQNLYRHSKERTNMTIVYVCYSSSTSPHSINTGSTPAIKLSIFWTVTTCSPSFLLGFIHGQVKKRDIYVTAVDHILALRDLQKLSCNQNALFEVISPPVVCRTTCPELILWSITFPISILHPFRNLSFHTYAIHHRKL